MSACTQVDCFNPHQSLVPALPAQEVLLPLAHAGALRNNIGINRDYMGRPREVLSEHGMVAADQGRCSEIGDALPDLPSLSTRLTTVSTTSRPTLGKA